jgi:hypothetical protein
MERTLKLEIGKAELLVLELTAPAWVRALSGTHWLTVDGLDVCLSCGEQERLPAGKVVIEGNGRLQFSQPEHVLARNWLGLAAKQDGSMQILAR